MTVLEPNRALDLSTGPPEGAPRPAGPSGADLATTFFSRWGPLGAIAVAVCFGLWEIRAQATPVAYLNDSSIHDQMVRYATTTIRAGHLPYRGWFPFLQLGSPQFMHYQSLGATLTGLVGLVTGPDRAFAWSTYLLVALWPLCIYWCARLFELDRWTAAAAGVLAPFVTSAIGIGYEQRNYLFIGFGVWSQLFAMWTLPLAWGFTWRALTRGRFVPAAVVLIAATVCFHYITGYLAFVPLLLWPWLKPSQIWERVKRAALVLVGAVAVAGWVIVPLIKYSAWASLNEYLQHTPDTDSYGARRVLSWLFTGHIFDNGRWPIITVLAGFGLCVCIARARQDERARAIVIVWVACVVLFFGRPTLGPLFDLLPGSQDAFLRRFIMGVQLGGLLLAGIGAVAVVQHLGSAARTAINKIVASDWSGITRRWAGRLLVGTTSIIVLAPAWTQIASADSDNAAYIQAQQSADTTQGPEVNHLIDVASQLGPGRFYAGLPTNWGQYFLVGTVPVFKYLESQDVDEVGYLLRTQSLMDNPEAHFDEYDAANYSLFGIRYLLLPFGRLPTVPGASRVATDGLYVLWEISANSYFQVVDTVNPIIADRSDLGAATALFLTGPGLTLGHYQTIAFDGRPAAPPSLTARSLAIGPAGSVLTEHVDLVNGMASARIRANRQSVVLLSASYDPGWTVTVDGRPATTEMVAPALVGVEVSTGNHTVQFVYVGYEGYPLLFAIGAAVVAAIIFVPRFRTRRSRTN